MTNSTFNKTLSIDWLCAHSGMSREVTAASTPTYLRRGLRGCLRNGGESMSAARVTCFLAPIHQRRARGWAGRK